MPLIRGDRLPLETRQEILRRYPYRHTVEKPYYGHGKRPAPTETDAQWLASKCFHVTMNGRLDGRFSHCEAHYMEDDYPVLPWQAGYERAGKGK